VWPDNETERDFLNFAGVADTVAEIIVQAHGRPISVGVSGAWGVGKSSMIKLIQGSLSKRPTLDLDREFVFVEFNAWLYQGYDDARAALMDVIAQKLVEEAKRRSTAIEKTTALAKKVNWFRLAKLGLGTAVPLMFGLPPVGLLAELWNLGKTGVEGGGDKTTAKEMETKLGEAADVAKDLVKAKQETSPPKEIHLLRQIFEETLAEMKVTLVVLIDDLDRCLPETAISTLEAIRLFLFLKNTAFVVAADTNMIKHAVRKHFEGIDNEEAVTSYFDKLIQIPLRVPPLGTQEVRAYLLLLLVDNSALDSETRERLRVAVCKQLTQSWQGRRVDRAFVESVLGSLPNELVAPFEIAERLAPIMTSATGIAGNPRLIKRFLNALAIRLAIARAHSVAVDEAVLAKLLLFERLGHPKAYAEILRAINHDERGKPTFLHDWEEKAHAGNLPKLDAPWDDPFVAEWLTLPPRLGQLDLRGALYVGREHAPLISPADSLSSEAAELLTALLKHPDMAGSLKDRLLKLARAETTILMDRVLERARQEEEWGTPSILDACLAIADADPVQGTRLAAFLQERPASQIKPSIVPKVADRPWSSELFKHWNKSKVSEPVKKAINRKDGDGNLPV
jgi:predicted KAP-like P-loop ATPase